MVFTRFSLIINNTFNEKDFQENTYFKNFEIFTLETAH